MLQCTCCRRNVLDSARFWNTNFLILLYCQTRLVNRLNETANQKAPFNKSGEKKLKLLSYFIERKCQRTVSFT